MSEPEISRRCLTCGATVRQTAAFCPQCGQVLDKRQPTEETETQLDAANQTTALDEPPIDTPTESAPTVLEVRSPETVIMRRDEELEQDYSPQHLETRPLSSTKVSQRLETAALPDATVNELPAPIVTRVDDNDRRKNEPSVLERVEKLRKASTVMIDQASYDPSLRFLLVTAVLVVLFVVLMILSKLVG